MTAAQEQNATSESLLGSPTVIGTKLRMFAREVVRSVWPGEDDYWLTVAQLQVLRKGSRYSAFILTPAAFLVAQSCAQWVRWDVRMAWAIVVGMLSFASDRSVRYADRHFADTLQGARIKSCCYFATALAFECAWCSMSVFLWAPGVPINHLLLAVILAISFSGAVALSHGHLGISVAVLIDHFVFLVAPFALSPSRLDHILACLAFAYVALMTGQIVALNAAQKKMLVLEHERSSLVEGLRRAKEESDRERSRAAAAGRAKSQFLSNMNHELRTPMNAILGFSELISQKAFGAAVDKYAEYADIIHQSGLNLLRLIDDILDLAKIEGGKLSLREGEVNLAGIIGDLREEYEPKAIEANLSFATRVAPGLPKVFADERALRQILVNLASNAIKFTPAGGAVTLFAQVEGDGRMAFGADDTGIGISDIDQSGAFERFGGGRHDVTSGGKGTGLGLAIVKGFAEAHDGSVALESAIGIGTRVTAYLPASRVLRSSIRKAS